MLALTIGIDIAEDVGVDMRGASNLPTAIDIDYTDAGVVIREVVDHE